MGGGKKCSIRLVQVKGRGDARVTWMVRSKVKVVVVRGKVKVMVVEESER